ncbi:MAG: major facilitator superfamily 1 [Bryobacterales bacterium]|nr:major facilitator superfamily 1 [Bryobacterales bacterium]
MQEIAQNWLVLEITKSPFLLGIDAFLGDIPIFMFSLFGGVLSDRMDRRHLLIISQLVQMCSAIALAVLIATEKIEVWHILVSSFVVGTAQAFGGPAYSALVPSLVEKEDLPNAIALNSIQFNLARIIGPVIGGLALKYVGSAWCFGLNSLSFVAVIISLLRLNINFKPPATAETIMQSMKKGFGFIRSQTAMETLIAIAFCMTALAIPMITFLPVFAKDIFKRDALTYTLFLASSGLGSITGAVTVAALGNVANKGRIALSMLVALGAGMSGFALSTSLPLSCILLFCTGAVLICAFAMFSSLVQLNTPNDMRGRVMSVYNVAFRGGMPIGSLTVGWLVPMFGAPHVLAISGFLLGALGLYFLTVQRNVAEL